MRDLCVNKGLHGSHVTFMDVHEERLSMISRLAERLSGELNAGLSFTTTTDRQAALKGADFVINTALDGGHDWAEEQRGIAEKHGYYRGTALPALAQIAFFLEVARDIERICPNAWLIESANPVFEGCTAMSRQTNVKLIGLCHGHHGVNTIAKVLGLEPKHVTAKMPGFNHWIWLTEFLYKGENAYPLLDEWIETKAQEFWTNDDRSPFDNQMRRAAIHQYQLFGLMPIGDTPRAGGWWYHTDLATKQRWYGPDGGFDSEIGWAKYLVRCEQKVRQIEQAALDQSKPITDTFPAKRGGEQIVPIINSLVNNVPGTYQVNIPNKGPLLPGFPENLVVECQATVDGSGMHGNPVPALPRKLMVGAMIPRWQQAELIVEAACSGDPDIALIYLLRDHRTRGLEQAEGLLNEWLAHPRNTRVAQIFTTRK